MDYSLACGVLGVGTSQNMGVYRSLLYALSSLIFHFPVRVCSRTRLFGQTEVTPLSARA